MIIMFESAQNLQNFTEETLMDAEWDDYSYIDMNGKLHTGSRAEDVFLNEKYYYLYNQDPTLVQSFLSHIEKQVRGLVEKKDSFTPQTLQEQEEKSINTQEISKSLHVHYDPRHYYIGL